MAAAAHRITGGQVLLNGKDILTLGRDGVRTIRGAKVCYVAQSAAAAFNPAHRLGEQVIEASLRHSIMSRAEAEKRALYLFRVLGLPNPETFGDRYPHQVSGGQLQRAMTAMALCPNPELIVFDEPTTALDVTTQIDVLAAIKHAIEETHTAALYITHDLAVVAQISDDIMVLRHGKTVEYGTDQADHRGPARRLYPGARQRPPDQARGSRRPEQHASEDRACQRRLRQRLQGAARRFHASAQGPDAGDRRRKRLRQIDAGPRHHRPPAADRKARSPSTARSLPRALKGAHRRTSCAASR